MAHRFMGLWRLLPELCKYDAGQPPAKATYSFTPHHINPALIQVAIEWTDLQSKDFSVKYEIELGKRKAEKFQGLDVEVLHELTQKGQLNSTLWHSNEKVLMRSYRELKEGDRLQVVMETPTEKGINRIFQVYEKAL